MYFFFNLHILCMHIDLLTQIL